MCFSLHLQSGTYWVVQDEVGLVLPGGTGCRQLSVTYQAVQDVTSLV